MNAWDFGILPSGSDQTAAIQAAINASNGRLNFLGGTYVASGLTGKSNFELTCEGRTAIFHSDANAPILTFTSQTRFGIGKDISLDGNAGTYPSISDSGQKGLVLDGCSEFSVAANITRISGAGIEYKNAPYWYTDGDFNGIRIAGCYKGFYAPSGGEFARISNFTINRCLYGIHSIAGNQVIGNGWMTLNSTAIKFETGPNGGHSTVNGVTADHNNYALVAVGLDIGLTISGCQMEADQTANAGNIAIYNSRGIIIANSQLGCNFLFDGTDLSSVGNRNGVNKVVNCFMRTDISGMAAPLVQNGATTPQLKGNFTTSGDWAYNN